MRKHPFRASASLFLLGLFCLQTAMALAAETPSRIRVAVASNFLMPMKVLARAYEKQTQQKVLISAGSTGKLYAQIINGAPFDIFLAANEREPQRLEDNGNAVKGSRFTYAKGKLALWDPKANTQHSSLNERLKVANYRSLSMANPLTAPYGAAANATLENLQLKNKIKANANIRILRGENVSQAYQYIASGAAELGFIALSQLKASTNIKGQYWLVDESLHQPILQQAVLLNKASEKAQAKQFLAYLKSSEGQSMINKFGYGQP